MNSQYCRVGTVTPITKNAQAVDVLEYQYQVFLEKAANADVHLMEFFEAKAKKIRRVLEELV